MKTGERLKLEFNPPEGMYSHDMTFMFEVWDNTARAELTTLAVTHVIVDEVKSRTAVFLTDAQMFELGMALVQRSLNNQE